MKTIKLYVIYMGTFKTQKMAQMRATSRSAAFQVFKRWTKQNDQSRYAGVRESLESSGHRGALLKFFFIQQRPSKVFDAAAWPITVLVLVFKFSDRVRDLLDKLTEVSLPGGISGKFEQPLKSAEKLAERLDQTEAVEVGVKAAEDDPVALNANPTGVIMEAWKGLEAIGSDLYQASDAPRRDKMLMMYTSASPGGVNGA
jgi:hypothetical protein